MTQPKDPRVSISALDEHEKEGGVGDLEELRKLSERATPGHLAGVTADFEPPYYGIDAGSFTVARRMGADDALFLAASANYVRAALSSESRPLAESFQPRVGEWMQACFGEEISKDGVERNHRFLEEALELVQSLGCTASEAHQLVDYVFGRDIGDPHQETGGVMVTLAALCLAHGLGMAAAGEDELARIWTKVEQIRAKQAAKPKHSPLPGHAPGSAAIDGSGTDAVRDAAGADPDEVSELKWAADMLSRQAFECALGVTDATKTQQRCEHCTDVNMPCYRIGRVRDALRPFAARPASAQIRQAPSPPCAWDPAAKTLAGTPEITRLRQQVEACADRLIDQRDEPWPDAPWPDADANRLHYWRDKAINVANDLRALLKEVSDGASSQEGSGDRG